MGYVTMNDTGFLLRDPGKEQKKVVDQFRLTEIYRDVYGNHMLDHMPNGKAVRDAVEAIQKYKGIEQVDVQKWKDLIIDLMYSYYVLGFKAWEYFVYGLENKTITERLEFMPQRTIRSYRAALKSDPKQSRALINKYQTYQIFEPYYKREILRLQGTDQKEAFFDFCRRHPRFMIKPIDLAIGEGIEIVNCEDYASPEALYTALRKKKYKRMLCEELIVCEDSMRAIHPQSVNSVRVFTYLRLDGTPTIVCAWLKAGRGDAVIDNGSSGGMLAAIDAKTGVVYTDAADEDNHVFPTHPDSGFVFKGFQIPRWQELRKTVLELSPVLKGVRMVGWDMALSQDRGWQLIEGNGSGMINVIQVATKTGCRREFEDTFEWNVRKKMLPKTT